MAPEQPEIQSLLSILEAFEKVVPNVPQDHLAQLSARLESIGEVIRTCREKPRGTGTAREHQPAMQNPAVLNDRCEAGTPINPGTKRANDTMSLPLGISAKRQKSKKTNSVGSKIDHVANMIASLDKQKKKIDRHARLPSEERIVFDWTQDDVRVTHCLTGVHNESKPYLRLLACRSLALEFEGLHVGLDGLWKQAHRGAIDEFIRDRLSVEKRDR